MKLAVQAWGGSATIGTLPEGDDGVAATIAAMQAVVDDALTDPISLALLRRLVAEFDIELTGPGVFAFCKEWVRFAKDPAGMELLRTPAYVAAGLLYGEKAVRAWCDCDDLALLGCVLLTLGGLAPVLCTVGRSAGGRWEHVFFGFEIRPGGPLASDSVLPLDPQELAAPGEWPLDVERVALWRMRPARPASTLTGGELAP
jgi:hypothetical protein